MPVVEIVRRGRGGRQEITFKRVAPKLRPPPMMRAAPPPAAKPTSKRAPVRTKAPRPMVPIGISSQAAAALFSATCPAWDANMPLELGAHRALNKLAKKHGLSKRAVSRALETHCGSKEYLRRLAEEGALRHSIDGVQVEPVSAEHSQIAKKTLAEME
jgi:hypothetical protein